MNILIAIGGNSIEKPGQTGSAREQIEALDRSMAEIAELVIRGHRVVLTHGNGPQVGRALLRTELTGSKLAVDPLHICGAETQGRLGYLMSQSLSTALRRRERQDSVLAVITRVRVDPEDPDFENPSKPVGSFYPEDRAEELAQRRGYRMVEDAGRGWRRVVPSPRPLEILEEDLIRDLVSQGALVICCGGGGIPVVHETDGRERGIDAVIDKDRASALLADALDVDIFLLTTGVERVAIDFGQPSQRDLDRVDSAELRRLHEEGQFPRGSMGPKIESALEFLHREGRSVLITSPERVVDAVEGRSGTRIVP